jgi:DNA-binding transcriptional ArsR family regulator
MDDDAVFKALADPTRRHLLDRLHERDGRTLGGPAPVIAEPVHPHVGCRALQKIESGHERA